MFSFFGILIENIVFNSNYVKFGVHKRMACALPRGKRKMSDFAQSGVDSASAVEDACGKAYTICCERKRCKGRREYR